MKIIITMEIPDEITVEMLNDIEMFLRGRKIKYNLKSY